MRLILGITLLLVGVGRLSCNWELSADAAVTTERGQWVRTVDGWERTESWFAPAARPVTLHPLIVAAGQGLLSLLALAAFQAEASRRR